ncbi:hypothetical protein LS684_18740 [Cytobacillus spongiae]|uniref:hypothetical protein n=1 Tax=Cytobacillus spongiae TaxID=2901381 RepID=UPI001F2F4DD1|nr:hypothetical protein [Cytobacillus spongiae]UII55638.1 hypothetical protein LS684_18740 [Cytobacillus spongiae]
MSFKSFVYKILFIVGVIIFSAGSFIYLMDPMWTFSSKHRFNDVQTVINERQQKTNRIHFQPFEFDTLLLGSSRSTYINQHDFQGMDVYNYAVSNMSVREYNSFIEFAKKERGQDFTNIIIGLDFFKSSTTESNVALSLDQYTKKLEEPFYRYKNLLSLDLLEYSWQNFKVSKDNKILEERNYNRSNVAVAKEIDPELKEQQTVAKIQKFRDVFYGETYEYNPEYKKYLLELKENNPNTNFIIFTTPISNRLFEALVDEGRYTDYERWLQDITSVFGGVHNFMYPNSITNEIENYFDGHHFYPHVGTAIARKISNPGDPELPPDFGKYVDSASLAEHLAWIKEHNQQLFVRN